MGLLEEAIREHLDLKRKHGASDDELLREESDALGPARRDQEEPVEHAEPEATEDGAVAETELAQEEPTAPPPEADLEEPPSSGLETPLESPVAEEDSVPEETPDFIEDTPEHDRLSLEQKPPRDFDFD